MPAHASRFASHLTGLTAGGLVTVTLYLWVLGRVRLEDPDLERWQEGQEAAWETPRLAAGIRPRERVDDLPVWRDVPVRR